MNQNEDSGERSEDEAYNNTRRQFVAGSAGALGGIAVGSALSGSVLAQDDGEEETETDDEDGEPVENEFEDDVAILNYALTLEYLEASFYRQGLENISEEDLCNCKALSEDSQLRERAYDELTTIQQHEEQHVETLVSTIESLGGTPVEEPEFDFGLAVEYPMAFLGTAVQLEDIGVSAYAGAAPSIESEDLIPPALGIHSVEARHAAFLRTLNGQTSFPAVVDEARSRSEVLELASPFIVDEGDDGTGGNETEAPTENGTEMPTDNGTEMPTDNGTEMPADNGTEMPTTNGTETNGS
ncbi:ferritin-like domain-containing protein [Natronomonas halophila]|uniref:ferritin-like domain-containing protein n=1 Tax=Natronomonas halophila TaxID=2747817 RepID=UPI0015B5A40F|nr:ferritin-like domain-containing protein [Natronomonas halophila]QLD87112.1 ferritin-like domain-containing protein [Natronomonas halophila]